MTLNQTLIDILTKASEKVGIFIDWTSQQTTENIIPYINELCGKVVMYQIATSALWMVITGVGIFMFSLMTKKCKENVIKSYDDEQFGWAMTMFLCVLILTICVIVFISQTLDVITALTFPELTVVDFVKGYISNNQ